MEQGQHDAYGWHSTPVSSVEQLPQQLYGQQFIGQQLCAPSIDRVPPMHNNQILMTLQNQLGQMPYAAAPGPGVMQTAPFNDLLTAYGNAAPVNSQWPGAPPTGAPTRFSAPNVPAPVGMCQTAQATMQQSPTLTRTAAPSPPAMHNGGATRSIPNTLQQTNGSFAHSADTLEEVLTAFASEFPGSQELMSDLMIDQDQILRDTVFPQAGAVDVATTGVTTGQSIVHSVFEYDPNEIAGASMRTPMSSYATVSTSAQHVAMVATSIPPVAQQMQPTTSCSAQPKPKKAKKNTTEALPPRIIDSGELPQPAPLSDQARDKIRARRDKELAEIDQAFERHMSMIAKRQQKQAETIRHIQLPHLPQLNLDNDTTKDSSALVTQLLTSPKDAGAAATSAAVDKFTFSPPTSPGTKVDIKPITLFDLPSTSSTTSASTSTLNTSKQDSRKSLEDLPKVFIPASNATSAIPSQKRVPIWKRQPSNFLSGDSTNAELAMPSKPKSPVRQLRSRKEKVPLPKLPADEYEFDEPDESGEQKKKADKCDSSPIGVYDANVEAEVARKLKEISTLHPELKKKTAADCLALYNLNASSAMGGSDVGTKRKRGRPRKQQSEGDSAATRTLTNIRNRRQAFRMSHNYARSSSIVDDDSCACAVTLRLESSCSPQRTADKPKVILRIPKVLIRQSVEQTEPAALKPHRRKRRHEADPDYAPASQRRRRHQSEVSSSSESELDEAINEINPMSTEREAIDDGNNAAAYAYNRKKRLMQEWAPAEASNTEASNVGENVIVDAEASNEHRLAQFFQPLETLHKGQFVVSKSDIGSADCAMWKVDNQNLLQKYCPEIERDTGRIVYRNSSTYAGWCAQNACRYVVVRVHVQTQTRTECVVAPEYPLDDLLPAVSLTESEQLALALTSAIFQTPSSQLPPDLATSDGVQSCAVDSERQKTLDAEAVKVQTAAISDADMPLCNALETYLHALLLHYVSGTFLNTIKVNHDWKYLRHINDVDKLNEQTTARMLKASRWRIDYQQSVETYVNCECSECPLADARAITNECQACGTLANITHTAQLFGDTGYDFDTLELTAMKRSGSGSPMPTLDYYVCERCYRLTSLYHALYHMRYKMFLVCENQIEAARALLDCDEPSVLLEHCLGDRAWMKNLINDNVTLWRRISDELNPVRY